MEWVETTGRNIEEATAAALDELGVADADAEVEVVEEPKAGLFGRTRGAARVRARVRPTAPRPKQERRRGGRGSGGDSASGGSGGGGSTKSGRGGRSSSGGVETLDRDADDRDRGGSERSSSRSRNGGRNRASRDDRGADRGEGGRPDDGGDREPMPEAEQREAGETFLTGILAGMEFDGEVTSSLDDEGILRFEVTGENMGLLIGPGMGSLDALQEVCRNVIQRQAAGREYGKVELDVAGARADRREALEAFTRTEATRVLEDGDDVIFDVMSRSDRKVVHDVIGEYEGVLTESVGEDPRRRVVLRRA